jgi:hypothetical protein
MGAVEVNTCRIRAGRLLEIRAWAGYRSAADVDTFFRDIANLVRQVNAASRLVIATDWRRCPLMSSEVSDRLLATITRNNPRMERSAALIEPAAPTAALQFTRLVRGSASAGRMVFEDPNNLVAWLAEVLTAEEVSALRAFIREGDAKLAVQRAGSKHS